MSDDVIDGRSLRDLRGAWVGSVSRFEGNGRLLGALLPGGLLSAGCWVGGWGRLRGLIDVGPG